AAGLAAQPLCLALDADRVDGIDLDVEQAFDSRLDLALCRVERNPENDLIVLGCGGRLLGDHRRAHDVVHLLTRQARLSRRDDTEAAHRRRASSCCTAARVRTSVSRRRMAWTVSPRSGNQSTC